MDTPFDDWFDETHNPDADEWDIEDDADDCIEDDYSTAFED